MSALREGFCCIKTFFFLPHLDALCKPNLMVKTECSGRGRCEDGQCVCNKVPVSYAVISYCLSSCVYMNYVMNNICLVIIIMLSSNLTGVKNYFIRQSPVCLKGMKYCGYLIPRIFEYFHVNLLYLGFCF